MHLIFYHFSSLHLTLSFSLWTNSHLTPSFPSLVSITLSSIATVVPSPITSLAVAQIDHHCLPDRRYFCWSLLLSFFSVWWFWDFDQWVLMVCCSIALSSLTATVPPPINSLTVPHANRWYLADCRYLANHHCSPNAVAIFLFFRSSQEQCNASCGECTLQC